MKRALLLMLLLLGGPVLLAIPAAAEPWVWDQDQDGLDDRLQDVAAGGIIQAFENLDPEGRLRFEVGFLDTLLQYGAYVCLDHFPTAADSVNLVSEGAEVVTVFKSVPYVRVRALFPVLQAVAARPEVVRVEAVSLMYPLDGRVGRALALHPGKDAPRLTAASAGSAAGHGVVVAVLDTGINDQSLGLFPGHESVAGKVVGGANYSGPGPVGYTPWSGSVNPMQSTPALATYHGTYVAAAVAGWDSSRVFCGAAPRARLLDVKVLDDFGTGHGVAEGLEWCIQNAATVWGPGAAGIQVINLSLSGTDLSTGEDCVSALVDAAAAAGVTVVAAAGNDGTCGDLASPGSAEGAVTVGASSGPDSLAAYSSEGPRTADTDGVQSDEMKPDVAAPGHAVSAWGEPVGSGAAYVSGDGTSVSTAWVSGLVALILSDNPSLTPAQVKTLLRDTADRRTVSTLGCGAGVDPFALDPRYHAGWGWGLVHGYGAYLEAVAPGQTQFLDVDAQWDDGAGTMSVSWTTQRELDLTGFHVERALDAGGAPGAFSTVTVSPVPAAGYADLTLGNRTVYVFDDAPPPGARYWYRVRTNGGTVPQTSAPVSARSEAPSASWWWDLEHPQAENTLTVHTGSGPVPSAPAWIQEHAFFDVLDSAWVGPAPSSHIDYQCSQRLYPAQGADGYLPPGPLNPWFLSVQENGSLTSGSLKDFRVFTGSTWYVTDTPVPKFTSPGVTSILWIPAPATTGTKPDPAPTIPLRVFPNPVSGAAAARIQLHFTPGTPVELSLYDVSGRLVRTLYRGVAQAGALDVPWGVGEASVVPGVYYLRLSTPEGTWVKSVVRLP